MLNLLLAPLIAAATAVLGFGAGIVAYQVVGLFLTAVLVIWGVLIRLNRAFWLYDEGLLMVSPMGRVARVVRWSEVMAVEGVRVDLVGSVPKAERRDFRVHLTTGRPIIFNDFLIGGGAQLAEEIAAYAQADRAG
jgi:hypothetical protein